jgi:hypothetical protein
MAWDTVRQRLVLFGRVGRPPGPLSRRHLGVGRRDVGATHADQVAAGHSSQAMASDPVHRRVVLFGGLPGSNPGPGTWEWGRLNLGSGHTDHVAARAAQSRNGLGTQLDSASSSSVACTRSATTAPPWLTPGSGTARRGPNTHQPRPRLGRSGHSMAWDAARQRAVLFGGLDDSNFGGNPLAETWEWDGATWAQRTPTNSPSARRSPGMAWEASRQRVVLFGGPRRQQSPRRHLGVGWLELGPAHTGRISAQALRPRDGLGRGSPAGAALWGQWRQHHPLRHAGSGMARTGPSAHLWRHLLAGSVF